MLYSILYALSIISLITSFLIIKKSSDKQNLIKWIIITIGLLFCYNSIISYFLNLFFIKITLVSLTITNLLFSFVFLLIFLKSRQKQNYYILKRDIFAIIFIGIIILLICLKRFNFNYNISYETSDPGVHFWTAKDFFDNSYLLNNVVDKTIVDFQTRQFSSYVNLGILFKVFSPIIDYFDFYKLYIIFDIIMLLLSAFMFYFLISDEGKKIGPIFFVIYTLLYVFGYPLNSTIFGFFYLGHSLMIINLIVLVYKMYKKNHISNFTYISLLSFASMGLFFTYYFFVPIIYISLFFCKIYNCVISYKKINTIENLLFFIFAIIIPFIAGLLYFIYPNLGNSDQNFIHQLSLNGFCYIDIINNFILFIPINFYYIIYLIKNKKISLESFIFIVTFFSIIIIIIMILKELASIYYLSKIFYLLWFVSFYLTYEFICEVFDKSLKFDRVLIFISCVILLLLFLFKNKIELFTKNYSDDNYNVVFGIYKYNYDKIFYPTIILKYDEMEDLKKIYKSGIRNIYSNAIPYARVWLISYFETKKIDYPENQLYNYIIGNYYYNLDSDELSEGDYVVLFYRKSMLRFYYNQNNNYYDKNFYDNFILKHNDYNFKYYDTFLLVNKK